MFALFLLNMSCSGSSQHYKVQTVNQKSNLNTFQEIKKNHFLITESVQIANISPEDAKKNAINNACKKALEFGGISFSSSTIDYESNAQIGLDNFASISNQTSRGIILSKELISENTKVVNNTVFKIVTMKIQIAQQAGKHDPNFAIDADLNRDNFKDGEEIKMQITPSSDCYLYIFNICADEKVYMIFPNVFLKNNRVAANKKFVLPNQKSKNLGINFTVQLAGNQTKTSEIIKIVATKNIYNFPKDKLGEFQTYESALENLQKWMLKIPLEEMTEVDLHYFITEK